MVDEFEVANLTRVKPSDMHIGCVYATIKTMFPLPYDHRELPPRLHATIPDKETGETYEADFFITEHAQRWVTTAGFVHTYKIGSIGPVIIHLEFRPMAVAVLPPPAA